MRPERLIRIVYVSRAVADWDTRPDGGARGIEGILATSRRNNRRAGLTGALIYNRSVFGQVLEGPERAVEETALRIEADPRHHDMRVLDLRAVPAPAFADWSMGFVGPRGSMDGAAEARRTTFDLLTMGGDAMFATLHRIAMGEDDALRVI
jgi:hypothetical protein